MSVYLAEYIWIDGTEPTPQLRSKTKVIKDDEALPVWGFDGSSTNQAPGESSDCALKPVFTCPDPLRGGEHKLVLCEVCDITMQPHPTNTRARARAAAEAYSSYDCLFGIEQEYTFFQGERPLGWPQTGFPAPQGPYYCGVGADRAFGREIVEAHMIACLDAGLAIEGINAEVMPGQWEFQIGPCGALEVSDQLIVARWLLHRIAEDYDVIVSFHPKPVLGDWNGAGAHTNFSTRQMRASYDAIEAGVEALSHRAPEHIAGYGADIALRLTGKHETCSFEQFRAGVSNRGASIRIPWHVAQNGKGYMEDRRPNANCDPYTVTSLLMETICGAAEQGR